MRDPKHIATYEELYAQLEALPEGKTGEIIDGELIVSPRPAPRHSRAETRVAVILEVALGGMGSGPASWVFLTEPELHLQGLVMVPDVAGWRVERMPTLPDLAAITLAPDWVCEVLSPKTARLDRIRKLPKYAKAGVPFAWIVDPIARTLETFVARRELMIADDLFDGNAKVRAKPFEAIELDLSLLWGP